MRFLRSSSLALSIAIGAAFAALFLACSGSNADNVPAEVRDASPLDVATANEDANRGEAGQKDSPGEADGPDGAPDGPPSGPDPSNVRINEVYVDRTLSGAQVEFVELRGE